MADINQTAAWVTARLTELGNATNDGLNTLVTDSNIGNYNAKNVNDIVPVAKGGTGASDPAEALNNLGAMPINDVSEVGKTGDYDDLLNKPTIPTISNTYDSVSTDGMSGVAVAQAIAASDTAMLGNIAADFSTAKAYTAGDYCVYEGELYVFTADKAAGAWDASVVSKVSISDVLKKNTFDIADIEDGMYTPGNITWADFANTEYPLGWRQGNYSSTTGAGGNNNAYIRTVKNVIDWDGIDHFTVTAPEGYYVQVTEYVAADDSFLTCYGRANADDAGRTTSVTVKVTKGHYYLFSVGKQTNLFNYVDAAFAASIILETYVNKADLLDKALNDIVAEEYDPTATYAVGDYCLYDLALYQCSTEITVAEAWHPEHWTEVSLDERILTRVEDGVMVFGNDSTIAETSRIHAIQGLGNQYNLVPEAFENLADEYDSTATYSVGDLVIYERQLYRCVTTISTPEAWNSVKWQDVTVKDELDLKANTDGYYETMTVGNAEQLLSSIYVEDKEPYTFRTTGGSNDVGNRELDTVVGGSVVWNQLISKNSPWVNLAGASLSYEGTDAETITQTSTTDSTSVVRRARIALTEGHVYIATGSVTPSAEFTTFASFGFRNNNNNIATIQTVTGSTEKVSGGVICKAGANNFFALHLGNTFTAGAYATFENCLLHDLTLMFGPTIADYIYNLEQSTAGAGVAWFRKLFPKDYYAYNAGEIMSVSVSSHDTVGFNAYNPTTGTAKLLGGKQYQITGTYTALSYVDINGNSETITPSSIVGEIGYFTPATDGTLTVTGGNDTDTCVHLVWSGYRDDEWEEYSKHSYPLDSSLTLRGIPKLTAANGLYFDGDIYASDGTVTRRYGTRAYAEGDASDGSTMLTDGTNTIYKLTTPTTESATPYQNPQICDDFGTEEYVDYAVAQGTRDVAIPVGHVTEYMSNNADKLAHLPNLSDDGDGVYLVSQSGRQMTLMPYVNPTVTVSDYAHSDTISVAAGMGVGVAITLGIQASAPNIAVNKYIGTEVVSANGVLNCNITHVTLSNDEQYIDGIQVSFYNPGSADVTNAHIEIHIRYLTN